MSKFFKQRKGITLISLIVTIIVLVVLAGITISLTIGQDGLIKKAKETKPIQDIATAKEKLEMLKAPTKLNTYDVNLDNYLEELDRVKEEYEVNDVERINETNAEVVVGGKYKFLIKDKQNGDVEIIYQGEATELILSATSGTYIYPTPGTFEVVKNITGGELSVKSENENIAKVSISGTTVTVEPGTTTGTVEIIVTAGANGKYAEQKAVYLATVVNGEIELSATAYTGNYDGLPHNAITNVEVTPEDAKIEYSIDGEEYSEAVPTVTGAKGYTVSIRASKVGYTTKTISKTVTIGKAQNQSGNLVLSKTEGIITYPTQEKITVSKNISGGELSITSSNEDVATATIDKLTGEITITPKAVNSDGQKTTITVTSGVTANYAEQSATYVATVNRGTIEIEATAYTGNYDGTAHNAVTNVNTTPTGTTLRYKLDSGSWQTTIPQVTNASEEYTIVIEASKAGYTTKTKTITVTIGKQSNTTGNLVLSATSGTLTYPTAGTFTVTKNTSGGILSVNSSNTNIATASIDSVGKVIVVPGTTAGTATITVTSAATSNYEAQTATYTATVQNGTIEINATAYTGNYDGTAHNAVTNVSTTPTGTTLRYKLNNGSWQTTIPQVTNASEEYTVVIEASKAGYTTKTKTITVTIGKQANTTGNLVLSAASGTLTYPTAGTFTVTKNTSGGTLSVSSSNTNIATASIDSAGKVTVTPGTTAGTATITVTSAATSNYEAQSATYTATVQNGTITINATAYTGNYDGTAHNAVTSVSTTPTGTILRYKLDSGSWQTTIPQVTNASEEYTIVIEASKAGYTTKTKTITVTIGKQSNTTGNLVLSATSGTLTYPTAGSFTVTKNTSGGTLSVASSNTAIATASIDSAGKVTVTPGTTAGTATITVTSAATTNYEAQTAKYTATVKNGTITLEVTAYTGNYDGTAHNAVTVTKKSPSDVTIKYSIDGGAYSTTVPTVTGAKEYTVSIQASKSGYTTNTITKTVTVNKAAANSAYLTLSATSGTITYPTAGSFTVTKNTSGGTLSVASSNTNIATATISGTTVTVKPGTTAGTATITVTSAATTNYEAQTAKYTATVKNGTITLEATAYTGNYDGTAHNAVTVTKKSPSDVTIKYSIDGGAYSATVPTVTGAKQYTVSIQASKAGYTTNTITKTVTVGKQANTTGNLVLSATSGTLTYPTSGSFTITKNTSGGTLSVASSNTNIATASISGTTVTVKPGTTAGTATITVTSAATANYEAQTAKYTATVKNGTITLEATAYTGNYDGAAHNAVTVTKKSPSDVTIKYSIDGGAYSTTVPTVTGAKEYTVSIQASKAGYTTKTISKTVTVGKQANTTGNLVLSATSGTLTYPTSGTFTVKTNTSGGTLSVASSNTAIATASISGTTVTVKPGTTAGTATITVTSAATTNYEAQTAKYTATVKNGTITLEATAYTGNYDGAAHNAVTVTKKSPSDVTIKYSIDGGAYSTTVPTVTGAKEYTVSIQASKAGYTTKTISKTVTVGKQANTTGNLVLSATSGTLTYPTSGTFTVKTNTSGGTLSVSSSNTNIATVSISGTTVTVKPGTTAGTATITVTSAATTNYEAQTAKYTATVKNGTITLEATPYTGNYDEKAHNAVTITKKSPSDVTIKYSLNGGAYSTSMPTVTNEGTYTVSIQASKAGYTTKTISKTVTILEALMPYDNPYIPTGFVHTEGTWNNGYTIKNSTTGDEFVWVPCVTDQSKVRSGDTVVTFKKYLPSSTATTDPYYKYNAGNFEITGDAGDSMYEIQASVAKYGGFYIAKYEAGISGTTQNYNLSTKTKTDGTVKPLSQKGKGIWNGISRTEAIKVSEAMIDEDATGAKSALINGACWDTTLQWMVKASDNKDNEPNLNYDIDSTNKGLLNTGSSCVPTGYFAVNNIYDMAGNICEWSTENLSVNGGMPAVRGTRYGNTGTAATRWWATGEDSQSIYVGFRVVMYKPTEITGLIISDGELLEPDYIVSNTGTQYNNHASSSITAKTNTSNKYFGGDCQGVGTGGVHSCSKTSYVDITLTLDDSLVGKQCTLVGFYRYNARYYGVESAYIKNGTTTIMSFSGNNADKISSKTFTLNSNTIQLYIKFKCNNDTWCPSGHIGIRTLVIN